MRDLKKAAQNIIQNVCNPDNTHTLGAVRTVVVCRYLVHPDSCNSYNNSAQLPPHRHKSHPSESYTVYVSNTDGCSFCPFCKSVSYQVTFL